MRWHHHCLVAHEPDVARRTGRIVWFRDGQVIHSTLHQQKLVRWQHRSLLLLTSGAIKLAPPNQLNFGETTLTWVGLEACHWYCIVCYTSTYCHRGVGAAAIMGISSTGWSRSGGSQPAAIFYRKSELVGDLPQKRFHSQTPKLAIRECLTVAGAYP